MDADNRYTLIEVDHYLHLYDVVAKADLGRLCEEVRISRKMIDLLEPKVECVAQIWFDGEVEEHTIKRRMLNKKKIYDFLLERNVSLLECEENIEAILTHILNTDKDAEIIYKHNVLGFVKINGQLVWLAQTPIGGDLSEKKRASQYAVPFEAEQKGTFAEWQQVIKDEILGNTPLEFGVAVGASAPIVHLLRQEGVFSELPIWGIIGPSSQGKSTLLKVIALAYGSTAESIGLVKDVNATKTAFFKSLEGKIGLPLLFDEATGKTEWSISSAIYDLSKGVERATCSSSRNLNPRSTFSGAIVISGENTLLKQKDVNLGLLARLCEITTMWTRDAAHSRRICQKLAYAHGTAVVPLITHILAIHKYQPIRFQEMFLEELTTVQSAIENSTAIDERIFNMYAGVLVGARIANEAWNISLDVDAIRDFLVKRHKEAKPVENEARKLYDFVLGLVNRHNASFITKAIRKQPGLMPSKVMGELVCKDGKDLIWFEATTFEDLVINKFPNYLQLLDPMYKLNLIRKFGDKHFRSRHALHIGRPYCYCFFLVHHNDGQTAEQSKKKSVKTVDLLADETMPTVVKKTSSIAQSPQMQYLLADSDEDEEDLLSDSNISSVMDEHKPTGSSVA